MLKFHVLCAVVLVVCLTWGEALPVKEQDVEDLIYKLQQLKQLNDAPSTGESSFDKGGGEKEKSIPINSHLAATSRSSSSGTPKAKRSLNNSDRRTLLYQYYARGLAPMYDKRNFDEIDRYSKFSGKRTRYDMDDLNQAYKRNFDEIDRWANFNSRLNNDPRQSDYVKRNFDEIDRYAKFNKRTKEFFDGKPVSGSKHDSQLADEMGIINEYSL
ncbi:uncharacterized protein LOC131436690 [Malaya genurostris]|uniref:uncharacterized protein LOC131436690 n=1 Tax=Malaya genurostris TaxID=325434 RepID=UPI0026F3A242|nr:uncharacterized protein LOC131436690 [Malaya genurostris]